MKKKTKAVKKVTKRSKPLSKRSQGGKVSKRMMIVFAAVVVLAAGALYFMNQGASNSLNGLVKTPLNPNCELNDPDVCKFINNYENMRNYSFVVIAKDKSGKVLSEHLTEIAEKDKTHYLSKAKEGNYETIMIGDVTYTKDFKDNAWWKTVAEANVPVEEVKVSESEEMDSEDKNESNSNLTYKLLGKEACGKLTCFKYETSTPGSNKTDIVYIWFDDKEYLIRKQLVTEADGSSYETTFTYGNINISAPSPVKEGGPEDMYMQGMSEQEKAEIKKMQQEAAQMQGAEQSMPAYDYTEETVVEDAPAE